MSDLVTRFWSKVNKTESCWIWLASGVDGYGRFWNGKKKVLSHRFSYELLIGKIPEGLVVDHLCRNRACVNPAHMEIKTAVENLYAPGSMALVAINSAKTHCINGHEFSEENTSFRDGQRYCKACNRDHWHRNKHKWKK